MSRKRAFAGAPETARSARDASVAGARRTLGAATRAQTEEAMTVAIVSTSEGVRRVDGRVQV
jgi:hypothetical protein